MITPEPEAPRCVHNWIAIFGPGTVPICDKCNRTPNASPSQVETRLACPRKHSYSRIRDRVEGAPAKFGKTSHAHLEDWGKSAAQPPNTPEGRTLMSMIGHVPPPMTALHEFRPDPEPIMAGVRWIMLMDWIDGYEPGRWVSFGDYKTTGSLKYAKASEHLATKDPQGLSYGHFLAEYFQVQEIRGRWTYALRCKGDAEPKAGRVVDWTATRDELRERFTHEIAPEAHQMCVDRVHLPIVIRRDLTACGQFGGCPYKSECYSTDPLTPADIQIISLHAIRGKSMDNQTPTTTPATAAPDLIAKLQAASAAAPPIGGTAAPEGADAQLVAFFANATRDKAVEMYAALVLPCPTEGAIPKAAVAPTIAATVDTSPAAVAAGVHALTPQGEAALAVVATPAVVVTTPTEVTTTAPEPVAETTDEDFPDKKGKGKGKGRPTLTEASKLLNSCAAGGMQPTDAAAYLELLAIAKGAGK